MVVVAMALLSFADSTPRAYRLKVGNASFPNSTTTGAIPCKVLLACYTEDDKLLPICHAAAKNLRRPANPCLESCAVPLTKKLHRPNVTSRT